MPQIVPIRDLRDTNKISQMCHESNAPIYVTKNGYDDMVIMSSTAFDTMFAKITTFDAVMEGSRQIDAGEGIDGETVKQQLRKKYKK